MGFKTTELFGIGATTLSGDTEVHGVLTVYDNVDFLGTLEVSGNLYVDGEVTFTGSTVIGGTLEVNTAADFHNGVTDNSLNGFTSTEGFSIVGGATKLGNGYLDIDSYTISVQGPGLMTVGGVQIGASGSSGTSGTSGESGTSGTSGESGTSGSSGTSVEANTYVEFYYDNGATTLFVPTIDTSDVIKSVGYQSHFTSTDQSNFYMTNYDNNDNFIVGNYNALPDSTNYSAIYMTTGDTMTITGNVIYNGTISMGESVGINGSFYASTTSGGTCDTLFTFVNGILVANPS